MDILEALQLLGTHDDVLIEMARIGHVGDYDIIIWPNEGGYTPHFHLVDSNSRGQNFHTCIRLDEPSYFHHTCKEDVLNSKQKKMLVNFLQSIDEYSDTSYWKTILIEWNRNSSNKKLDINSEMPDYTKL